MYRKSLFFNNHDYISLSFFFFFVNLTTLALWTTYSATYFSSSSHAFIFLWTTCHVLCFIKCYSTINSKNTIWVNASTFYSFLFSKWVVYVWLRPRAKGNQSSLLMENYLFLFLYNLLPILSKYFNENGNKIFLVNLVIYSEDWGLEE